MMMMIAVSSIKSGLVPLIEGLCAQICYFRFEIIGGLCLIFFVERKNMFIKKTGESQANQKSSRAKRRNVIVSAEILLSINKKMDCNYNVESKTWETSAYTCHICMHLLSNETGVFFSFLSWVASTQPNHWTKRMVRIRVITGT